MRRSIIALAVLSVATAGCQTWRTQTAPAPQVVAARNGRTVRIMCRYCGIYEMSNAVVVGDSIVGSVGRPPRRAAVAVADVERIEVRRVNALQTAGLAAGTYVAASLVVAFAVLFGVSGSWDD
jgi:hypothetical protein